VLRANGRVDTIGDHGPLLGLVSEPELADNADELAPGDALILYTDGLTDAYAPGRILKRAELLSTLGSCAGQSATAIAQSLRAAALGRWTTEPRDDIALLVLRVLPVPRSRRDRGSRTASIPALEPTLGDQTQQ
jgi:serine phosphatase RsbU (regulator of sigma subunit)